MTSRPAAALIVLASTICACRSEPPPRPAAQHPSESRAPSQDTAFAGTMAPVQRVRSFRPGVARPVLRYLDTGAGASPGYDRVVFQFMGGGDSVPGYRVEYTTKPVQRCGSGDPVTVAGAARLIVRFEPAVAHDELGKPTPASAERHRAPGLPAVLELTLICDFEGQVAWVLGIAAPAEYRVSELTGPARSALVLDVRHAP